MADEIYETVPERVYLELMADRARLDWLDASECGLDGGYKVFANGDVIAQENYADGVPIRDAIDAAMKQAAPAADDGGGGGGAGAGE